MDRSVSELQQSLCSAAKADKSRRFHSLYDKLYREDVLREAWNHARANKGTAGIDGKEIEDVEREGVQAFLGQISKELKEQTYRPSPLKRVWIPKPNGKQRPLSIPTLKDRIVQTAAMLILQPIFEQDFEPNSYGFREGRSTHDAVREVVKWLNFGYENVIDADITSCFDSIPKSLLMKQIARRVVDGSILSLVKQWLSVGILDGGANIDSGEQGVAQGSPISPLLSNIFLDQLDKAWNENGMTSRAGAHLVRYADDFVILGRSRRTMDEEALGALDKILANIGLSLSKDKTRLVEAGKEGFDFLGFHFVRHYSKRRGKRVTRWFPSNKSQNRIRRRIRQLTSKSNLAAMTPYEAKDKVVEALRGWGEYFKHSMAMPTFYEVWGYANACLGRMNRRWHQKKRIGRYKEIVSKGLSVLNTRLKAVPYAYNAAL